MKEYKTDCSVYRAPTSGYYTTRAVMTRYRGTGKFETVRNIDRRWFQFWKPKTVTQEIYERIEEKNGIETKFYNQGDVIQAEDIPTRGQP